jgi:adenylosuccinate synthase
VVTGDGRHHTFAQFGSGSFTPGVRTHLSRFVLVDPLALAAEAAHLASVGVLDALEHPGDALRVADCAAPRTLAGKLARLRDRLTEELGPLEGPDIAGLCDAYRAFAERVPLVDAACLGWLLHAGPVVFEGAQGVLLDEWRGFHPYTTWSTTTFANAEALLAEADQATIRLGVVRSYLTRHGPGPFVTEDSALEFPSRTTGTAPGRARSGPGIPTRSRCGTPSRSPERAAYEHITPPLTLEDVMDSATAASWLARVAPANQTDLMAGNDQ